MGGGHFFGRHDRGYQRGDTRRRSLKHGEGTRRRSGELLDVFERRFQSGEEIHRRPNREPVCSKLRCADGPALARQLQLAGGIELGADLGHQRLDRFRTFAAERGVANADACEQPGQAFDVSRPRALIGQPDIAFREQLVRAVDAPLGQDRQLRLRARLGDPVGRQRGFLAIDRRQRRAEQRAAISGGIDGVRGGQRLLDRFLDARRRQERLGDRRRIDERGKGQLVAAGCRRCAKVGDCLVEHEMVFRHPQLGERRQTVTVTAKGPNRIAADLTK